MLALFLTLALIDGKPKAEPLAAPAEVALDGWYTFSGVGPGGEEYAGIAYLERQKEVVTFRWFTAEGQTVGVGLRDGNQLTVAFREGQAVGICRYRIELADGKPKLVGVLGVNETAVFLKGIK